VIVGASLAGATAAITLRQEGADGPVTLIGAETEPPYERPLLSKSYLGGEVAFDKALVRPAAFYADHGIETMFGMRATRIDTSARTVELEDHRRVLREQWPNRCGSRSQSGEGRAPCDAAHQVSSHSRS
jgi:3-phenylpropionate/trans-cinnamate dioxygenase ferredoxin reductase subunit